MIIWRKSDRPPSDIDTPPHPTSEKVPVDGRRGKQSEIGLLSQFARGNKCTTPASMYHYLGVLYR